MTRFKEDCIFYENQPNKNGYPVDHCHYYKKELIDNECENCKEYLSDLAMREGGSQ